MEKLLLSWEEKTIHINNLVRKLRDYLADNPVPKSIRDGIEKFYRSLAAYSKATESDEIEKVTDTAKMVAVYGKLIAQAISKYKEADDNIKTLGNNLLESSNEFQSMIEDNPLAYMPIDKINEDQVSADLHSFQSIKKSLKVLADEHQWHDQRVKKLLNENELRIENISNLSKNLEIDIKNEIKKVSDLYEYSLTEIESKRAQIDEILGHVSGRAIAGDFEKSAGDERSMADWLRYASLTCMILIVFVVAYSFWDTTSSDFSWEKSTFRIVLALMLSIPAAYLARESAKHREQQYAHQQTSLDLKAIAPYIASLPEEEQHKIKIEIAGRLFASKDFSNVSADPYPINTHEIIMEIIKKLDVKRSGSKP